MASADLLHRHGALSDVLFPVTRGRKVQLRDHEDFERHVKLVDVRQSDAQALEELRAKAG